MANKFLKSELRKIARLTDRNYHTEARQFIARKIKSPTLKEFDKIEAEHRRVGSLTLELQQKRMKKTDVLMKEIKRKLGSRELTKIQYAL